MPVCWYAPKVNSGLKFGGGGGVVFGFVMVCEASDAGVLCEEDMFLVARDDIESWSWRPRVEGERENAFIIVLEVPGAAIMGYV